MAAVSPVARFLMLGDENALFRPGILVLDRRLLEVVIDARSSEPTSGIESSDGSGGWRSVCDGVAVGSEFGGTWYAIIPHCFHCELEILQLHPSMRPI